MATPDFSIRSDEERKTHELFYQYRAANPDHGDGVTMVGHVFMAKHYAALPAHRIELIAAALNYRDRVDLTQSLALLVRAKVLRSYRKDGVRHYEVNY